VQFTQLIRWRPKLLLKQLGNDTSSWNITYNELGVIVLLIDFCTAFVLESILILNYHCIVFTCKMLVFQFTLQVAKFINLQNNTLDKFNLSNIIQQYSVVFNFFFLCTVYLLHFFLFIK
jgi:hypothetical protein